MAKKIFTIPSITLREKIKPPALSTDGQAVIYLDRATSALLISVDGGPFVAINATATFEKFVTVETVDYAPVINISFTGPRMILIPMLTGDLELTDSNLEIGQGVTIRMTADGTDRNLTFPAWTFYGSDAPTALTAGKTGILALQCWGASESDIDAIWIESV